MKISCPHCSQRLELDPETLAALHGQPHFACPVCGGLIAVPTSPGASSPGGKPEARSLAAPALKRKQSVGLIITGLSVLAVIAAGGFFFFGGGSKIQPFTNTLGMKFVPVPGTKVLFCIHETRYKDYAAYAAEADNVPTTWKNQRYYGYAITERSEDHPVTQVSWEDAQAFCVWLSKKEEKTYRLPTDEEWSTAVGLVGAEQRTRDTTPVMLSLKETTQFPWGGDLPPKTKDQAGNYSDESRKAKAPRRGAKYLEGYDDGFPTTAPVCNFKPNKLGIYDLGGNVWEWCEDWYDKAQKDRVLRGGAWEDAVRGRLLSSSRPRNRPDSRYAYIGFRCVIEIDSQTAP